MPTLWCARRPRRKRPRNERSQLVAPHLDVLFLCKPRHQPRLQAHRKHHAAEQRGKKRALAATAVQRAPGQRHSVQLRDLRRRQLPRQRRQAVFNLGQLFPSALARWRRQRRLTLRAPTSGIVSWRMHQLIATCAMVVACASAMRLMVSRNGTMLSNLWSPRSDSRLAAGFKKNTLTATESFWPFEWWQTFLWSSRQSTNLGQSASRRQCRCPTTDTLERTLEARWSSSRAART